MRDLTVIMLSLLLANFLVNFLAWRVNCAKIISQDHYKNVGSQHNTQVEPCSFAFNKTVVAVVQTGRFYDGGCTNICWTKSIDGGINWSSSGCLPGITVAENGPYDRVSDPTVAYDSKHKVWMVASLAFSLDKGTSAIAVSRSLDGGNNWLNPVFASVATGRQSYDKDWIVCDNWRQSPYFGNCYIQWDDSGAGNLVMMATSTDGGLSWKTNTNRVTCIGGQPLVQPNGVVIVPSADANANNIIAWRSTDGGQTWTTSVFVSTAIVSDVAGNMRADSLPSASIDGAGRVIVTWQDCRFRANCYTNDIVYSSSTDGVTWSAVARFPIDSVTSTVDHFIPGFAMDPTTSGSRTVMALTYYYFPNSACTNCNLSVGFISSADNGATWTSPITIAGPFSVDWIADTGLGRMVGDYITTSISGGKAIPIFTSATAPSGSTLHQFLCTSDMPIPLSGNSPTAKMTSKPISAISKKPSLKPSSNPSSKVTFTPTFNSRTSKPSTKPSGEPTNKQTTNPTIISTSGPTSKPTSVPSAKPTMIPTSKPSTSGPTSKPSPGPTSKPTSKPTIKSTSSLSTQPTCKPTAFPIIQLHLTIKPSAQPTSKSTIQPTSIPTQTVVP